MSKLIPFLILLAVFKTTKQFATCTTKETCIRYQECDAVMEILRKGNRLSEEDKQYFKKIQCKALNHIPYVCCAKKINFKELFPKAPICGLQFTSRIVGGAETTIEEHPWIVQIQYAKTNGEIGIHCGGALCYVLTAAHCDRRLPKDFSLVQVRLGDWDVTTNPDCDEDRTCNDPYVEIPIDKVIVHEDYNPYNTQSNDIALIKLKRSVEFTKFIKSICLPIDLNDRAINLTNHEVGVAGFGQTECSLSSDRKLKVGVTINSQEFCKNVFKSSNIVITDKQLCAGGEPGKDSCGGDSGGPLMKQINKPGSIPYFMLVGLVSFVQRDCGTKDQPGVYTRISEYMDWIANNMD